jgi:hypothetical protein
VFLKNRGTEMNRYKLPANGFENKRDEQVFWRRVIMGQRRSRLTGVEFCKRYGLKQANFRRWTLRLKREAGKEDIESKGLNFMQVKVGETIKPAVNSRFSEESKLEVELLGGNKVRLPLEKDLLIMVINLLKE